MIVIILAVIVAVLGFLWVQDRIKKRKSVAGTKREWKYAIVIIIIFLLIGLFGIPFLLGW